MEPKEQNSRKSIWKCRLELSYFSLWITFDFDLLITIFGRFSMYLHTRDFCFVCTNGHPESHNIMSGSPQPPPMFSVTLMVTNCTVHSLRGSVMCHCIHQETREPCGQGILMDCCFSKNYDKRVALWTNIFPTLQMITSKELHWGFFYDHSAFWRIRACNYIIHWPNYSHLYAPKCRWWSTRQMLWIIYRINSNITTVIVFPKFFPQLLYIADSPWKSEQGWHEI